MSGLSDARYRTPRLQCAGCKSELFVQLTVVKVHELSGPAQSQRRYGALVPLATTDQAMQLRMSLPQWACLMCGTRYNGYGEQWDAAEYTHRIAVSAADDHAQGEHGPAEVRSQAAPPA